MTFLELVAKMYHATYQAIVRSKPAEPYAIQVLHDFNGQVSKLDAFAKQPNEGAKYLYRRDNAPFPPDQYLGITPAWLNAVDAEGLLNGRTVRSFGGDATTAVFSWAHGSPPSYYVPPTPIVARTSLEQFLFDAMRASPDLVSRGLTAEAIAGVVGKER